MSIRLNCWPIFCVSFLPRYCSCHSFCNFRYLAFVGMVFLVLLSNNISGSRSSLVTAFTTGVRPVLRHSFTPYSSPVVLSQYRCESSRFYSSKTPPSSSGKTTSSSSEFNSQVDNEGLPVINWYPGHIAKAEKELSEYLKKVDVVIEVRDCRIPFATTHPLVPTWIGHGKPHIVAMVRTDQISASALRDWKAYYSQVITQSHRDVASGTIPASEKHPYVYFVDSKHGAGIIHLKNKVLEAGEAVNARRIKRGIAPRAVRAAVIGFPNVGKSALINRLLGRKLAKSRNLPGVTRSLNWIRISGSGGSSSSGSGDISPENTLELLDSPGIIPAKQLDQSNAVKLAICNDIGEASYDRVVVASVLCDYLNSLYRDHPSYVKMAEIKKRFGKFEEDEFTELSGEEIVYRFADIKYQGNSISAADKLLGEFRKGLLGYSSLEAPPPSFFNLQREHSKKKQVNDESSSYSRAKEDEIEIAESRQKERESEAKSPAINILDVGKGNYEGW